jgi:hypothetical protein
MMDLEGWHGRKPARRALGVAVFAVLILAAAPLYLVFKSQSEDRDVMLRQLAIYNAKVAQRSALAGELQNLQAMTRAAPGLIKTASADLAAAQIQTDVKTLVRANAGEIRTAQTAAVVKTGGFETISVAYDLTVPLSHLRALTYAIESHTPYLFLDNVAISAPTAANGAAPSEPVLELRWTVRGYRWAANR